jgi:hypothetical protein
MLQYSSVLSWNEAYIIAEIESLVFFKDGQFQLPSISCLIKLNETILNATAAEIIEMEDNGSDLFKVKSSISVPNSLLTNFIESEVSFIDSSKDKRKSHLINFQKASFINRSIPKKNAIMNCVHTLRNVNSKTYRDITIWIQINRAIGVDKIRLCAVDYADKLVRQLKTNFPGYVEIVRHETQIDQVCQRTNRSACIKNFHDIFNMQRRLNLHEKICTIDCFISNKYIYDYISNYDIDELIFPRRDFLTPEENKICSGVCFNKSFNISYSMVEYNQNLIGQYGENVSYFRFDNFLVLGKPEYLAEKIQRELLVS